MIRYASITCIAMSIMFAGPPVFAAGALAVGPNGIYGYSSNEPSQDIANASAVAQCGTGCTVRAEFVGTCVAVAFMQSGARAEFVWADRVSPAAALSETKTHCSRAGAQGWDRCVQVAQFCTD